MWQGKWDFKRGEESIGKTIFVLRNFRIILSNEEWAIFIRSSGCRRKVAHFKIKCLRILLLYYYTKILFEYQILAIPWLWNWHCYNFVSYKVGNEFVGYEFVSYEFVGYKFSAHLDVTFTSSMKASVFWRQGLTGTPVSMWWIRCTRGSMLIMNRGTLRASPCLNPRIMYTRTPAKIWMSVYPPSSRAMRMSTPLRV